MDADQKSEWINGPATMAAEKRIMAGRTADFDAGFQAGLEAAAGAVADVHPGTERHWNPEFMRDCCVAAIRKLEPPCPK